MKRLLPLIGFALLSLHSAASAQVAGGASPDPSQTADAAAANTAYTLVAWSELGMHCMDGKDYSVFSVLPPYNVIHAQLLKKGNPPVPVTAGVTITYQATADAAKSINTISSTKTNFWTYVQKLFLVNPPLDTGIAGYKTQSLTPRALTFNSAQGYWEAVGIPTIGYDDARKLKPYPMAMLLAKDSTGTVLATAKIVLAVSDEMSCKTCHASGTDPVAEPAAGWENNADPGNDV
jgi:hypothetical protein